MYALTIKTTPQNYDQTLLLLHRDISWGWEEVDQNTFIIYFSGENQARDFKKQFHKICQGCHAEIQPVQSQDWNEDWKQYFTPITINNTFIVLPEWLQYTPSSLKKIIITPKMAFGTGHHATTSLCLKTLSQIYNQGKLSRGSTFLDLGTGSGILGIASAKLGLSGIGLDIDSSAVDNARENASLNNVQDAFQVQTGGIHSTPNNRQFNLIFANIIASTLKELAESIISTMDKSDSHLILSGILSDQAEDVAKTYAEFDLGWPEIKNDGEWYALVWTKQGSESELLSSPGLDK